MKMLSTLVSGFLAMAVILSCTPANVPQETPEEKEPPVEEDPPVEEEVELAPFTFSVQYHAPDNIFTGSPVFRLHLDNPNSVTATAEVTLNITTDTGKKAESLEISRDIPANAGEDIVLESKIGPGFYKASGRVGRKNFLAALSFGVDPGKIEYDMSDLQADFNTYWDGILARLEEVEMSPRLVEVTSHSSSARKVYFVELKSIGNGLDAEPETIHGYYVEPQDGQKHPVIMHYEGYDTQPPYGAIPKMYCPYGGNSADYAEFYVSTRGQMINARPASLREDGVAEDFENTYGDWLAYEFGNPDAYYYRGAFMDCVQCVRFMATRETSDMSNLFAEGKSQGGAFSYAVAALSPYPFRAIAPGVAFLGDFPEYFNIVSWPANTAAASAKKAGMTTEEMYRFLSYYDTKNLATRIPETTSVIANMGLLDTTCPPRTNQAPYNTVKTADKQMHVYPEMGHSIPSDWEGKIKAFFKERIIKN